MFDKRKNYVGPDGLMVHGVLIVGEAPGEQEMREGKPFVGASGKLLDSLLRKAGLSRDSFAVDNVIKCRPTLDSNELRGTWYANQAIEHCRPNLDDTIARLKPRVILALGNTPLERLTGHTGITRYRGYPLVRPDGIVVVPTYHPSYLLPRRGQKSTSHLTPAVIRDFQLALQIAKDGLEQGPEPYYLCDPIPEVAMGFYREWVGAGFPPLSIDIETPHKLTTADEEALDELDAQIIRVSYCFRPGYAMSIPWTPEYMLAHRHFLLEATSHDKIWWNGWHFDIPVIQSTGIQPTGRHIDAMWAWHYLQPDLPRGLESVGSFYYRGLPWKHLSKLEPAKYNAIDADAALQNWIGIERGLRKNSQYDGFVEFCLELDPFLQEAGTNGVHIDRRKRRVLYKRLRKQQNAMLKQVQPLIPQELLPRKRYKKFPLRWDGKRPIEVAKVRKMGKVCSACGSYGVTKGEHTGRKGGKKGIPLNPCYKAEIRLEEIDDVEFDVLLEFNPLSADQLIRYCQHYSHPVGRHPKTGAPTVDDHHLEKLIAKYGKDFPLYGLVTELRTVGKAISTYVEGLKPNANGVVQTQYTYAPATGRLSSKGLQKGSDRGVNLQNIPHRGDLDYAGDIRAMIIPRPGHVFVEADSAAIEAVFTGYFMQDPTYIALAQMGVHAGFAAQSLGLAVTPENAALVKQRAKTEKLIQILYERKKKTVHGCLTAEHEVLTPQGWMPLGDYNYDQLIAEWDAGQLSFRMPKPGVNKPYKGEMIRLEGAALDVLCTPDHRFPVWTSQGNVKEYTAQTLPKANSLPVVGVLGNGQQTRPIDLRLLSLVVATQADGHFTSDGALVFNLRRKRKIDRLKSLLPRAGDYTETTHTDKESRETTRIRLHQRVTDKITPWLVEKSFTWDLLALPQQAREHVLEEVTYWDGSRKGTQRLYYSTDKQSIDVIQALAHTTGKEALLRGGEPREGGRKPCYRLHFNRRKAVSLESVTRTTVAFDGRIYCPQTQTGYFLCRHNGKVFVSGNTSYGMGARLLHMLYPQYFPSMSSAEAEIDAFYAFVPKLKDWHHDLRVQAHKECYLQLPFGNYKRYFYDVFSYVRDKAGNVILKEDGKTPKLKLGEDSKSCVAMKPQGTAGLFMRQNARNIGWEIKNRELPFHLPGNYLVHDSYCLEVPDNPGDIAVAVDLLERHLTRPIPEMGGLRVGCEIKVGRDWDAMETVKVVKAR